MNQFSSSPRVSHEDRFKFFRKFAEIFASQGAPPVSTTAAANLPPVSTIPAANFSTSFASIVDTGGKFATGVNDTGGEEWEQQLKIELEKTIYLYANSITQRCPKERIQSFLIEDFFHLPPVANLELRKSPRIFEKIRNGPNGIIGGLGKTDS
jgi:hypothetical protein